MQGRNNLRINRTTMGMTRLGTYAEYMSILAASLIAVPQDMTIVAPALVELASNAWHIGVLGGLAWHGLSKGCRCSGRKLSMTFMRGLPHRHKRSCAPESLSHGSAGWN